MVDFKVEKIAEARPPLTEQEIPAQYTLVYYRDAIDDAGKNVRVEHGKERVTLDQLTVLRDAVQAKIDAIAALPTE